MKLYFPGEIAPPNVTYPSNTVSNHNNSTNNNTDNNKNIIKVASHHFK